MKVFALIVTYNPDISILNKVLESLENQIDGVVIIDNGIFDNHLITHISCNLIIKHLRENVGIAKATNIGIKILQEYAVDYVILSDQDTIYPKNYIYFFKDYISNNEIRDIAAFSPVFYDTISSEYKPIYVKKRNTIKKISNTELPIIVFQAIASGLIIDVRRFIEIGFMNEDLFIDYVDFEWCWRVNYFRYKIMCLPQLKITHQLGDDVVCIGNKKISMHNYIRYYYITRNTIYLSLYSKYINKCMKIHLFIKAILYPVGYAILFKPHIKNFYYSFKGMKDGFLKKLGKIEI